MIAATRQVPKTIADDELVALVRSGNLSGLGTMFDRHGPAVRRLLLRLGVTARDVDDLVQDTFLESIPASARFIAGASLRSWLFGIAVIVLRRHRRSVGRLVLRIQRWASLEVEPRVHTPDDELEWSESARRCQRALDQLPAKKRDVFVLVVVEELSGDEVAQILGIPVATVWTRLHYARREMARLLELDPP